MKTSCAENRHNKEGYCVDFKHSIVRNCVENQHRGCAENQHIVIHSIKTQNCVLRGPVVFYKDTLRICATHI
jgi:hypothetical protein